MKTIKDAVIELKGGLFYDCIKSTGYCVVGDYLCFTTGHGTATSVCTIKEFEAEAKRMQNKPNWDDLPSEANWIAQDADGEWFWFEKKPKDITQNLFSGNGTGNRGYVCRGDVVGDWRCTLEQRPFKNNALTSKTDALSQTKFIANLASSSNIGSKEPQEIPELRFTNLTIPESIYSTKKEPDNSWFEKGEFPPAGAEVEVFTVGEEVRSIHVVWSGDNVVFGYDLNAQFVYAHFSALTYKFRPIKSGCQKFIESAIDASVIDNGIPVAVVPYLNEVFERMFHAGFKSPEEIK